MTERLLCFLNQGEYLMYKIVCYYEDFFCGWCNYVCNTNLTLIEAQKIAQEKGANSQDKYVVEVM